MVVGVVLAGPAAEATIGDMASKLQINTAPARHFFICSLGPINQDPPFTVVAPELPEVKIDLVLQFPRERRVESQPVVYEQVS
jgi:hypothetical protein